MSIVQNFADATTMLDVNFVRENKEIVLSAIKNKKGEPVDLDRMIGIFDERKKVMTELTALNQKRNEAAKERNIEEGKRLKEEGQKLEEKARELLKEFIAMMVKLPNIPSVDTPIGPDESGNKVLHQWGEKPKFDFKPKEHFEIGEALGLIDNERGAKVAGSRFTYLKGDIAMMQFALIDLVIRTLTDETVLKKIAADANIDVAVTPFIPIVPPAMIKPDIFQAMGRLEPKEERYHIPSDDLYLIGSAEHTIGAMYAEEILKEEELPLRYIGYSTAFRREAGSYGKDTKGIIRMHQFDKLEIETYCMPGDSFKEQDFLVAIQEHLMRELGVPHQTVIVCTGDMGGPDQRQIDIECWMPGQDKYRETHSADLMGAYQARRLNTRVKRTEDGKSEFVHMNDATALAIGRTLVAIIENYQQADGSIRVPKVLQPYLRKEIIGKS